MSTLWENYYNLGIKQKHFSADDDIFFVVIIGKTYIIQEDGIQHCFTVNQLAEWMKDNLDNHPEFNSRETIVCKVTAPDDPGKLKLS